MKARALAANLSVKTYLTGFRQSIFCSLGILVLLVLYFTAHGQGEVSWGLVWGYSLSVTNFFLLSHHLDKYLSWLPRPGRFILNSQLRFSLLMGAFAASFGLWGTTFGLAALGGFSILKWTFLVEYLEDAVNLR